MMRKPPSLFVVVVLVAAFLVGIDGATAPEALAQALPGDPTPTGANIRVTRHNLSPGAPSRRDTSGNAVTDEPVLKATSTGEVCVFCHTPHGAVNSADKPLWNRSASSETYTPYSSSSLNATDLDVTGLATPSKLCLSCHDGSIAIGAASNAPGPGTGSPITFNASDFGGTMPTPANSMPFGRKQADANHGFTRRLGTDLRNDHPISFTFDSTLASADGELRDPSSSASPSKIANRVAGTTKPDFPLADGKVQCSTCHDPHRATQKFLLKNRLAQGVPDVQIAWNNWSFNDATDQICLGCHTRLGKAWQQSAHGNRNVATQTYIEGDAALRDFPTATPVWQAGCLNCHDTHTVAGSRRLLREGVDSGTSSVTAGTGGIGYAATFRSGISSTNDYNTTSALENTCFQCHSSNPVITPVALSETGGVPNIQAEFGRTYRMPIKNGDQGDPYFGNTAEVHDITDADGSESQTSLGYGAAENRHAECTDCHNPHRVVKADTILGGALSGGDTNRRTHVPARGTNGSQGNIASGALRGAWGVEPSYTAVGQTTVTGSTYWPEFPTFTVKSGDPKGDTTLPSGTAGTNGRSYLTREYQLCLKCHSNYANGPLTTDFPELKANNTRGTTAKNTNGMTRYTNVAAEYAVRAEDPPVSNLDQGEGGAGTYTPLATNHRSWHPVIFPTGRTRTARRMSTTGAINLRPPFSDDAKVGTQTMHCSDCHGSAQSWTQGSSATDTANGPNLAAVQGPHGSDNPFLLKGVWNSTVYGNATNGSNSSGGICGRCHSPPGSSSGFAGASEASHGFEGKSGSRSSSNVGSVPCYTCHIVLPHGWKNKAFLVNLNCVGSEGGESPGCTVKGGNSDAGKYTIAPYYYDTVLRITTWQQSGSWTENSCGAPSYSGKDWMSSACGF